MNVAPRVALPLLVLLLLTGVSEAGSTSEPPPGMVGLLEVRIFAADPNGPPGSRKVPPNTRLDVRAKPDAGSAIVAVLSTSGAVTLKGAPICTWEEACATLEIGYEQPALIALEHAGAWTRVVVAEKTTGWIKGGTFVPLDKLLSRSLMYLRSFDGVLLDSPSGKALPGLAAADEIPAKLVEIRRVGKMDWMKVEVLDGICGQGEGKTIATGWLPLQRADRSPAAWFYSRGC